MIYLIKEMEKPARDPRDDMPKPILRSDVLDMKDLTPGMVLKGTVRNVIDFGVFVDIGVHQDGLVHISELCDRYIKHPLEVVSIGDIVEVKVLDVDVKKGRISLTMKGTSTKLKDNGAGRSGDKKTENRKPEGRKPESGKHDNSNKHNKDNGKRQGDRSGRERFANTAIADALRRMR